MKIVKGLHNRNWLLTIGMVFLFSFFVNKTFATHLVGGQITYTYIGTVGSQVQYRIKVTMYRDCTPRTDGKPLTKFDANINVGFYDAGSKGLVETLSMSLGTETNVKPLNGGSNCSFQVNMCLMEGVYDEVVTLPQSNYGYLMLYSRCCRNTQVNLPTNEGQSYFNIIPPTYIKNSSPQFTEVPAPYICLKDTTTQLNTAKDPDGDSLVYKIVWPYSGGDSTQPTPALPDPFKAPALVKYNSGFSYTNPFGTGGISTIDPVTGLTTFFVPTTTGRYSVAFDVFEYRQGKLLSVTRRDIQLIVVTCPPNKKPNRDPAGGVGLQTVFNIDAGDTLAFGVEYLDDDTMDLTRSGDIFTSGSGVPKPLATMKEVIAQPTSVRSDFLWETSCEHGRAQPYIFTVAVKDYGCPPKITNTTFTIYVKPFTGTVKLSGPDTICAGSPATFTANGPIKGVYKWSIIGGTLSAINNSTYNATFNSGITVGTLEVILFSPNGCPTDTTTKTIIILPPSAPLIKGAGLVCKDQIEVYSTPFNMGSSYTWSVKGGKILSGSNTDQVDVKWGNVDTGFVYVVEKNKNGCISDTAELAVIQSKAIADTVMGSPSVCPNSKGVDYRTNNQFGSTYQWFITGGKQVSGGNSAAIKVDWGGKTLGKVQVIEITNVGCPGDTQTMNVIVDYQLYTGKIYGDTSVCASEKNKLYAVVYTHNSTYAWTISGGTIISGNGTSSIIVDWDKAGTGLLSVIETAWDSVNGKQCVGSPVNLLIAIHPIPTTSDIQGALGLCQYDTSVYHVLGSMGSYYFWKVSGNAILTGQGNDTVTVVFPQFGRIHLSVVEISKDSCSGPSRDTTIVVHPVPTTSGISGAVTACFPDITNVVYSVVGLPTSDYQWDISNGVITSGNGTNKITVDWMQSGVGEVRVKEVSDFGCLGKEQALSVRVDSAFLEINLVTTKLSNCNQIELYWKMKNNRYFTDYFKVYRTIVGSGIWEFVDSVPNNVFYLLDKDVSTSQYSYRYKVEARNICNKKVVSLPHRDILLTGNLIPNDTFIKLNWNQYEGWHGGTDHFILYRRLNDDSTETEISLPFQDTTLTPYQGLDGYRQCYRIGAVKDFGIDTISYSNIVCFEFDPIIFIPNAFTPDNQDSLNDGFGISLRNAKSFRMDIYNTWGQLIYTTTDLNKPWDGKYKGINSPIGVYLYKIQVQGVHRKENYQGYLHLLK